MPLVKIFLHNEILPTDFSGPCVSVSAHFDINERYQHICWFSVKVLNAEGESCAVFHENMDGFAK